MKRAWVLLLAVGCSGYEARPLDELSIWEELRSVRIEEPADGLGPDKAVATALINNPSLRAYRRRRAIAEARVVSAGAWANPELRLNIANLATDAATAFGTALRWFPGVPGESDAQVARAEARLQEALAQIEDREARLAADVRIAHARVRMLEATERILEASLAVNERLVQITRRREEGLISTRLETTLARLRRDEIESDLRTLASERAVRAAELSSLLGIQPETRTRLKNGPELIIDSFEEAKLLERPDVRALKHAYEREEENVRLANLGQVPWPRFLQTGTDDVTDFKDEGVEQGLGIEIPIFDGGGGAVAMAEARRDRARERYRARLHEVRVELHQRKLEVTERARAKRHFEVKVEPALEAVETQIRAQIDSGLVDASELLSLQDRALGLRRRAVRAEFTWRRAQILLQLTQGTIFEGR